MKKKTLIPVVMMLIAVVFTVSAVTCGKCTDKKANNESTANSGETVSDTVTTHEHAWKEHSATSKEWVSNIAVLKRLILKSLSSMPKITLMQMNRIIMELKLLPKLNK